MSKTLRSHMATFAKYASVPASFLVMASANAALDPAVTTAITASKADITEAGGLLIGLAVVAMGLRWVKATFF